MKSISDLDARATLSTADEDTLALIYIALLQMPPSPGLPLLRQQVADTLLQKVQSTQRLSARADTAISTDNTDTDSV